MASDKKPGDLAAIIRPKVSDKVFEIRVAERHTCGPNDDCCFFDASCSLHHFDLGFRPATICLSNFYFKEVK